MRRAPIEDLRTERRKYFTLDQLAEHLGFTRRTLYKHIEKGALKTRKIGGTVLVHIDDAREYVGDSPPQHRQTA